MKHENYKEVENYEYIENKYLNVCLSFHFILNITMTYTE